MEASRLPEALSFKGDIASHWTLWEQKFNLYLLASGKTKKEEDVKIAVLLNLLGNEGLQIYNTFEFSNSESPETLELVLDKFREYCKPVKNLVYEHFKFLTRDRQPGETVDEFITALRQLASTCEFKERDVLIRDRLVIGIKDLRMQEKMLQYPNLALTEAIQICRAMETSATTQRKILNTTEANTSVPVCTVKQQNRVRTQNDDRYSSRENNLDYRSDGTCHKIGKLCDNCGLLHDKGKCPAYNRYCSRCNKRGHYRKVCRAKSVHEIDDDNIVNVIESSDVIWTIWDSKVDAIDWTELLCVAGVNINFKVDTGSQVNILNYSDYEKLNLRDTELSVTKRMLTSYSGHRINTRGQIVLRCLYRKCVVDLLFYVLESQYSCSILGLQAARDLQLVTTNTAEDINLVNTGHNDCSVQDILNKYKYVFSGIGKVKHTYKITLRSDAVPHISAARMLPHALKDRVKIKLDQMVTDKVIIPITEPTDWVHPIVIAHKSNGDIRVCMDPRNLNMFIKRESFQVPTADSLFAQLAGAKYFTLLDVSQAFLQLPLDHESSKLCTIATPWGRYRYLRLPFGISAAPEIFLRFMYETLDGAAGVVNYFDDILIHGRTLNEHNKNLEAVLSKIAKSGLSLNLEKSKICVRSVKFLGHIISDSGISPDTDKTKAIDGMTSPKDKKELQRFLGMIGYLTKFIPNLAQATVPLRKLLSNKAEWMWSENEEQCFERLKALVASAPVLAYFDTEKKTVLSVDASPYGLGAVITQDGHPVEYASVSLSETQQRYNHIEKELLALVVGCERFHYYLYGSRFTIETDHRPLLGLLKKNFDDLSPRIQRLAMRLLRYSFDLVYVPGKEMQVADALSRDPMAKVIDTSYLDNQLKVYSVLATTPENERRLVEAIANDNVLRDVKQYVLDGWPNHKKDVATDVRKFWEIKDEIYLHSDVLFFRKRLIIPFSLRKEILNLLHKSHQGVHSTIKLARDCVYWPGITSDVTKMVLNCYVCQSYSRGNSKEPLQPHEVPNLPWEKIGIDFMALGSIDFLIVIDYFSKFLIVNKMSSKTASSVCSTLRNIFTTHGIPMEIVSDNGPPFTSEEVINFAKKYDIQLTTSSPYYPRSNGMVERAVQTVKGLMTKSIRDAEDPFLAVLTYNTTPKQDFPAPCELLMGRKLRTTVPTGRDVLAPKYPFKEYRPKLEARQKKQAWYYNRTAKSLPSFKTNQQVFLQKDRRNWIPARIVEQSGRNEYRVQTDDGVVYRRNRIYLRRANNYFKQEDIQQDNQQEEHNHTTTKKQENVGTWRDLLAQDFLEEDDKDSTVTTADRHQLPVDEKGDRLVTRYGREVKKPDRLIP